MYKYIVLRAPLKCLTPSKLFEYELRIGQRVVIIYNHTFNIPQAAVKCLRRHAAKNNLLSIAVQCRQFYTGKEKKETYLFTYCQANL